MRAPIYGWFREGFTTADLQDAPAFLGAAGPATAGGAPGNPTMRPADMGPR